MSKYTVYEMYNKDDLNPQSEGVVIFHGEVSDEDLKKIEAAVENLKM